PAYVQQNNVRRLEPRVDPREVPQSAKKQARGGDQRQRQRELDRDERARQPLRVADGRSAIASHARPERGLTQAQRGKHARQQRGKNDRCRGDGGHASIGRHVERNRRVAERNERGQRRRSQPRQNDSEQTSEQGEHAAFGRKLAHEASSSGAQ